MSQHNLAEEANKCRTWAAELQGTPEQPFLLRLAGEFDRLASMSSVAPDVSADDAAYYARRAAQEMQAVSTAQHPNARAAHLAIAEQYRRFAVGTFQHPVVNRARQQPQY